MTLYLLVPLRDLPFWALCVGDARHHLPTAHSQPSLQCYYLDPTISTEVQKFVSEVGSCMVQQRLLVMRVLVRGLDGTFHFRSEVP